MSCDSYVYSLNAYVLKRQLASHLTVQMVFTMRRMKIMGELSGREPRMLNLLDRIMIFLR